MKKTKPADVMVVAAHPDDAEFGVAGSVVRWVREGKDVIYVICTNGNKGSSDPKMMPEKLARIREREQRAAARVLGVREVIFLGYPDQELEDTPEFRKEIVKQIRKYRPYTVATGDPYRRYLAHRDHRIVGQVTLDAIFPYARDIHAYPDMVKEGLLPHKVREVLLWGSEDINHCVDISDGFPKKLAALRCHKSQFSVEVFPELEQRVRERCEALAEGQGFELAESFHREEARP